MKFNIQSFRRLLGLNLWVHAFLAVAGMVILFAFRVFPFAGGLANGFMWLYGWGAVLIFGIGDGYPPLGMKISGGIILASLALATLGTLVLNISLFVRLLLRQTGSGTFRICFLMGVASVLILSFFVARVSYSDEIASAAIMAGDIRAYERAVRLRQKGDINEDLYSAARWGQLRVVEYLVAKGADPNAKLGGSGDSVLSGAIPNVLNKADGNIPVVEFLRTHGATN